MTQAKYIVAVLDPVCDILAYGQADIAKTRLREWVGSIPMIVHAMLQLVSDNI